MRKRGILQLIVFIAVLSLSSIVVNAQTDQGFMGIINQMGQFIFGNLASMDVLGFQVLLWIALLILFDFGLKKAKFDAKVAGGLSFVLSLAVIILIPGATIKSLFRLYSIIFILVFSIVVPLILAWAIHKNFTGDDPLNTIIRGVIYVLITIALGWSTLYLDTLLVRGGELAWLKTSWIRAILGMMTACFAFAGFIQTFRGMMGFFSGMGLGGLSRWAGRHTESPWSSRDSELRSNENRIDEKIKRLGESYENAGKNIEKAHESIKDIQDDVSNLNNSIEKGEAFINGWKEKFFDEVTKRLALLKNMIDSTNVIDDASKNVLTTIIEKSKNFSEGIKTLVKQIDEKIQNIEGNVTAFNSEVSTINNDFETANKYIGVVEKEIKKINDLVNDLPEKIKEETQKNIAEMEARINYIKKQVEDKREVIAIKEEGLKGRLSTAKTNFNKKINNVKDEIIKYIDKDFSVAAENIVKGNIDNIDNAIESNHSIITALEKILYHSLRIIFAEFQEINNEMRSYDAKIIQQSSLSKNLEQEVKYLGTSVNNIKSNLKKIKELDEEKKKVEEYLMNEIGYLNKIKKIMVSGQYTENDFKEIKELINHEKGAERREYKWMNRLLELLKGDYRYNEIYGLSNSLMLILVKEGLLDKAVEEKNNNDKKNKLKELMYGTDGHKEKNVISIAEGLLAMIKGL